MKNVWLKDDTEKLLKSARLKYIAANKISRVTDDETIKAALMLYNKNVN